MENMERETGLEPATSSLGRWHSHAGRGAPGINTPGGAFPALAASFPRIRQSRRIDRRFNSLNGVYHGILLRWQAPG